MKSIILSLTLATLAGCATSPPVVAAKPAVKSVVMPECDAYFLNTPCYSLVVGGAFYGPGLGWVYGPPNQFGRNATPEDKPPSTVVPKASQQYVYGANETVDHRAYTVACVNSADVEPIGCYSPQLGYYTADGWDTTSPPPAGFVDSARKNIHKVDDGPGFWDSHPGLGIFLTGFAKGVADASAQQQAQAPVQCQATRVGGPDGVVNVVCR